MPSGAQPCNQIAGDAHVGDLQGMEPDSNSSPDKFQRVVEATAESLAPVIKSIGLGSL